MLNTTKAIVTTLVDAHDIIDSFVNYHLTIGFDRIFLFFDDPLDSSVEKIINNPKVTVVRRDDALHTRWTETRTYQAHPQYHKYINVEVMARQMLNMEVACRMAEEMEIDWLLHIDIDELFYSKNETVDEHFQRLERDSVTSFHYKNYEAVPESILVRDCFKEVTLFKQNVAHNSWWQDRRFRKLGSDNCFNYYVTGKTAGKVKEIRLGGISEFTMNKRVKRAPDYYVDTKRYVSTLLKRMQLVDVLQEPIILHYPVCGFEQFCEKYVRLGRFDDKWFGVAPIDIPFHMKARDIVHLANREVASEFYRKHVLLSDASKRDLIEIGLMKRIEGPAHMLNAFSSTS